MDFPIYLFFSFFSWILNFITYFYEFLILSRASLLAQSVKNLPAIQETWVRSLGQEDSLEKEMATHSSILAKRIPWRGEPGRVQSMGLQRVGYNLGTGHARAHTSDKEVDFKNLV